MLPVTTASVSSTWGASVIAGVNNTYDHIFPEIYIDHGVNNSGSKLPLVSTTPAVNCTSGTVAGPLLPL
jgi:hypothetical protein